MDRRLSYWVDSDNIIRKVDDEWDSFMSPESWSERASSKAIVGKPLFDFICDDITRMYVATMIQSVRVIPQTLFRPYRCDSPDAKRFMQMIITPEENGWVRISHQLIRSETIEKKLLFTTEAAFYRQQFDSDRRDASNLENQIIRCSLCNRLYKSGTSGWQEPDILANTVLSHTHIRVIYGICPNCLSWNQ